MRQIQRFLNLICIICAVAIPVFSQQIGPEAPILGKGTFGINGIADLEVALPSEYSYNPAIIPLALRMFKEDKYSEIDYGLLDFKQGPKVTNGWQLYVDKIGKNDAMRIARYDISSNREQIAYLGQGVLVEFDGETYEITYGRLSGKTGLGVTLIPYEKIRTYLTAGGVELGRGEAKSSFHYRIGGVYLVNTKVNVGAVYTKDKIDSSAIFLPMLTGLPEPVVLESDYQEKLWTVGAGWQPREGTAVFIAWQKGKISGLNLSEKINLKAVGLQQFINPKLSVRIGVYDKVPGYAVTYYNKGWNVGLSYSRNTYRRTEEYLGRANTCYLWIGKAR